MNETKLTSELPRHYAYPKFGKKDFGLFRVGGPGLGNLLFPWARAAVASREHDLCSIRPTWLQFVKAPILCGGDLRLYSGLFHRSEHEVNGLRRLLLLSRLPRYRESDLAEARLRDAPRGIIDFEGIEGFFESIMNDHEFVFDELIGMTQQRHLKALNRDFRDSMTVHVRRGDFSQPKDKSDITSGRCCMRIPLQWYIDVVQETRRRLRRDLAVYVFSDGKDHELAGLLELPEVQRLDFGSSIADLIALSRANVLVASGSTFSMWASYLGRMPVVWHAGQLQQRLYPYRPDAEQECDSPAELPDKFFQLFNRRQMPIAA